MNMLNNNTILQSWLNLFGRILLSSLFILSGTGKITAYAGTQQYMDALGVPGGLLPLVILFEVGAPLLLIVGFKTRLSAILLAGYSLMTAIIFHFPLADQMTFLMFWKNVSIAGGFLVLAGAGVGAFSLDNKFNKAGK